MTPSDIIVFAPLDLEISALSQVFGFNRESPSSILPDGTYVYDHALTGTPNDSIQVRVVQLTRQGALHAGVTATKLLHKWHPRYVVSFGIAGGFVGKNDDDVHLGDVLLAEILYYYEPAKETARKRQMTSGSRGGAEPAVLSQHWAFLPSARLNVACMRLRGQLRNELQCNVHIGPLASGEKLIGDISSHSRHVILSINRQIRGVEMEAAGIAAAVNAFERYPPPELLVIKGVSDDATTRKSTSSMEVYRNLAATRAATVLSTLVLGEMKSGASIVVVPRPETAAPIRARAAKVAEIIEPYVGRTVDGNALQRALTPWDDPPTVYYHWRMSSQHLHWVDFYILILIRQLASAGLPPHLLVSDLDAPATSQQKEWVRTLCRRMCGDDARVTWYSDMIKREAMYRSFAEGRGFDHEAREAVRSVGHHLGLRKGNLVKEEWLQFIAWDSRDQERCLVVQWQRHARIMEQLSQLMRFLPIILALPDITLGGKLAKFEDPGRNIFIGPPTFDSCVSWLCSRPPQSEILELTAYLDHPGLTRSGVSVPITESWPSVAGAIVGADHHYVSAVEGLLGTLDAWRAVIA